MEVGDEMVDRVHRHVEQVLNHLGRLFPGAMLTLFVRNPNDPEDELVVTCDDLAELEAMIRRSQSREVRAAKDVAV